VNGSACNRKMIAVCNLHFERSAENMDGRRRPYTVPSIGNCMPRDPSADSDVVNSNNNVLMASSSTQVDTAPMNSRRRPSVLSIGNCISRDSSLDLDVVHSNMNIPMTTFSVQVDTVPDLTMYSSITEVSLSSSLNPFRESVMYTSVTEISVSVGTKRHTLYESESSQVSSHFCSVCSSCTHL